MLQIELYVTNVDEGVRLFTAAFGLALIEDKPGFRQLRHKDNFDIMLFTPEDKAEGGQVHWPVPKNGEGGIGIEIVLTTTQVTETRDAVHKLGYKTSDITPTPWGTLEFTFHMKEGYLIRVKQPA